jgi:hypothetical protein
MRSRPWPRGKRSNARGAPCPVRRHIKTSFVFLVAGLLPGGYILIAEFVLGRYPPRLFITAHLHLLLVGFMLMNRVSGPCVAPSASYGRSGRLTGAPVPHL